MQPAKQEAAEFLCIAGREVRFTHPDKLYFSREAKLTKLDLVRYYLSVAPGALNGIRDRPLVLKRFVNGAEADAFYQKRAPVDRPDWLRTTTLSFPSSRTAEEIVVDDEAGLAWVVNPGCIELHRTRFATGVSSPIATGPILPSPPCRSVSRKSATGTRRWSRNALSDHSVECRSFESPEPRNNRDRPLPASRKTPAKRASP